MAYYITDAESLPQMPLGKLTAKDQILVLSGAQASIPVALFGLLKDLKVEFVTVPGMDGEEDPFALGYLFGYYAAQARPGEQVKLYNRGAELIPASIQTPGQKKKQPAKKMENPSEQQKKTSEKANPQKTPQKAQEEPFGELTRFLSGDEQKTPQKAFERADEKVTAKAEKKPAEKAEAKATQPAAKAEEKKKPAKKNNLRGP